MENNVCQFFYWPKLTDSCWDKKTSKQLISLLATSCGLGGLPYPVLNIL